MDQYFIDTTMDPSVPKVTVILCIVYLLMNSV